MTAKRKAVKRSIKVPRGTITRISYTPPKLPDKPRVDQGAKFYGRTRKGKYIIPRFYISPFTYRGRTRQTGKWTVIDVESAKIAERTSPQGYSKEEATKIAEWHRDNVGTWATVPF